MNNEVNFLKITDGVFNLDSYVNVDTNISHNLLVYNYKVNGKSGYNMVIGEVYDDSEILINYLEKIMNLRLTNSHLILVYSYIKMANDKDLFSKINFSKDGYDLLFNYDGFNNKFKSILCKKLKDIIIDPISKRFSSIGDKEVSFETLDYYQNLDNNNDDKVLKKIANY